MDGTEGGALRPMETEPEAIENNPQALIPTGVCLNVFWNCLGPSFFSFYFYLFRTEMSVSVILHLSQDKITSLETEDFFSFTGPQIEINCAPIITRL